MVKEENCHLQETGVKLIAGGAGWLTGLGHTCLSNSLNYALQYENSMGVIQKEYTTWLQPALCTSGDGASRRSVNRRSMNTVEFTSMGRNYRRKGVAAMGGEEKLHHQPCTCNMNCCLNTSML